MNVSGRPRKQDFLLKSDRQKASEEILIGYTEAGAINGARAFKDANKNLEVTLTERATAKEIQWKAIREVAA